jgi:dihydroxyacetone synthase
MIAMGWEVIDVQGDATNDVAAIVDALRRARNSSSGKPVFINIVTIIGYGSKNEGLCPTHGAALGPEDVIKVKKLHGRDPEKHFVIPNSVYAAFESVKIKSQKLEAEWEKRYEKYKIAYPEKASVFEQRVIKGSLTEDPAVLLPKKSNLPEKAIPTRQASGIALRSLAPKMSQIMAGSADLSGSTFVTWPDMIDFQPPSTGYGNYQGRQIRYGIREHAMAAIANGLAAYSPNAVIPVISTFFVFFLYAAPAIRMAALQRLRIICIATHDSIGIGEDGPTHQPIELASLFRAMPNVHFIRPADAEEVQGAWLLSLDSKSAQPTILSLSRQGVPLLDGSCRLKMRKGAYIVWSSILDFNISPSLILAATGSEVSLAIKVAQHLKQDIDSITVVSMPCQALFDQQSEQYKRSILPTEGSLIIAIEAWSSYGWARYSHASLSMHSFGLSGPQADLYEHFGFGVDNITKKIRGYIADQSDANGNVMIPKVGQFSKLLL